MNIPTLDELSPLSIVLQVPCICMNGIINVVSVNALVPMVPADIILMFSHVIIAYFVDIYIDVSILTSINHL